MYVCTCAYMYACRHVGMDVCVKHARIYAYMCMYVMYVCMYVYACIYTYVYIYI